MDAPFDAIVIGAGFGGLGAALALAEQGARVAICEALKYPGGCTSTFKRKSATFESGATLLSGLGADQLFGRWIDRYGRGEVTVDWIDPIVELRTGALTLPIGRDRRAFVDDLARRCRNGPGVRAFFAEQERTAAVLWRLFDDPSLLPPWSARTLAILARRTFEFLPLARLVGRSIGDRMRVHGVADEAVLHAFVDSLCQITLQCSGPEAEAPFGYGAMDYYWRGTGHVRGGVGVVPWMLWRALERMGVRTLLKARVRSIVREDGYWHVETKHGPLRARSVIANLLPSALAKATPGRVLSLSTRAIGAEVDAGWGAAMLYATANAPSGARPEAHHLELVSDPGRAFTEGNHLFVSISGADEAGRAPEQRRTMTISTHVPLDRAYGPGAGPYIAEVHERMRATLAQRAPEWSAAIATVMTASPRTFERFTGRPRGAVGGIPRRVGLHNYRRLGPTEADRDLWLVGDSIFPGQSALAAAIGGLRTAAAIL